MPAKLTAHVHHEDGSYWAEVVELPGCFASGDTLDELVECLREGIALYVDSDVLEVQLNELELTSSAALPDGHAPEQAAEPPAPKARVRT